MSLKQTTLTALLAAVTAALPAQAQKKPRPDRPDAPRQPAPAAVPTAREAIEEAFTALKAGEESRAVSIYDKARTMKDFAPARVPAPLIFAAGDHHFALGTPTGLDDALKIYASVNDSGLASSIERGLARVKRAEVLLRQDKPQMAREEIAAIRAISTNRRMALLADLGNAAIQLHLGQAEPARDALIPLIDGDEPVVQSLAMFSLGRAYVQLKQPEQAVEIFRKLWAKYGETSEVKRAVFLVGGIYLDRGDFMEARKLYEACSVIGAPMQTRVQPGDELIVKVSDPNYFARTRALQMPVTLTVPSGDREVLKLDKNPVSDVLYTGRIQTTLAEKLLQDGTLQVRGTDAIEMTYDGQVTAPRKVLVVDDGRVNIDSIPMADPPPRHVKALPDAPDRAKRKAAEEEAAKPILPTGRQTASSVNPGSPVYVQVVDADLDASDSKDTVTAQVVAHGSSGGGESAVVTVTLTETGPRTGVFFGSAPTAPGSVSATATGELPEHPAFHAIDAAGGGKTYWKGKPKEKAHSLEVDLRQPAFLGKLTWGVGSDPAAQKSAPTAVNVVLRGHDFEKTIPLKGPFKSEGNTVDLGGAFVRYVRFDVTAWEGDAPAIGDVALTDTAGTTLAPTAIDPAENAKKGVLEFDVGQTVSARFTDEENETPGIPTIRTSRRLGARYHDANINLATRSTSGEGEKQTVTFSAVYRLDLGSEPWVVVNDPDVDVTVNPDKLALDVFTEAGTKRTLELIETGPATGIFAAALPITDNAQAKDDARLLHVRPGDLVWATMMDGRNMSPGYKMFRHHNVLENRPTAGEFAPLGMLQTAWPFEAKTEGSEVTSLSSLPRSAADGHAEVTLIDPDALSRSGKTVPVKATALLSGTNRELTLSANASGAASRTLDLVLGDKDVDRNLGGDGNSAPSGGELSVAGDDLIRIAYADARVATAYFQTRRVYTADELKGQEKLAANAKAIPPDAAPAAPTLPILKLRDPQRRIQADLDARLKDFRGEMNYRLAAYTEETRLLAQRRDLLKTRLSPATTAPTSKPTTQDADMGKLAADDALKAQIAALDGQIASLEERVKRLSAMGASPDPARLTQSAIGNSQSAIPSAPSEMDKIRDVQTGPLTPGQAFEITIEDADLTAPDLDVRVRSVAGRLVDVQTLKATRDAAGVYKLRVETEQTGDAGDPKLLSLMPGGEVLVDYTDSAQKDPGQVDRVTYLTLASDAIVAALNPNFTDPVTDIRLGEVVHLQVTDFDQDRTPTQDRIVLTAIAPSGDTLAVICTETEAHSGVFRGTFVTDRGDKPSPADDLLQADYGQTIDLAYADYLRVSPGSESIKVIRLRISGGADGTVEGFSRQFRDAKDEMQLWYRTGQAAYQLGRKLYLNNSIERAEENFAEATDHFTQLVTRFPADPLAASANYYLGNIQAIKGKHREALARFNEVVSRWPKSEYVARARFKVGQSYEALGQFDQAADAYVLLTYHHPDDANVPTAMIRMMNYYARSEAWSDAVAIAQKFVDKFPDHTQAGAVALKAGQWLAVAERTNDALNWFVRAEKVFATKDREMPALLYWHAATIISSNKGQLRGNAPRAEKVKELFNRVVYDYPGNEFVPLAKIALEQMQERN